MFMCGQQAFHGHRALVVQGVCAFHFQTVRTALNRRSVPSGVISLSIFLGERINWLFMCSRKCNFVDVLFKDLIVTILSKLFDITKPPLGKVEALLCIFSMLQKEDVLEF